MPSALDATVGGPAANTYVTLADFATYLDDRPNSPTGTDAEKTRGLIAGTVRLEQQSYRGYKTDEAQALAWPRVGTTDRDGRSIDSDVIPVFVKRAQMELAIQALSDTDLFAPSGLEQFEELGIDVIRMKLRTDKSSTALPDVVKRELAHVLTGGAGTIRLRKG